MIKHRLHHARVRQLSGRDWRHRHGKVFRAHPEYRRACPPEIEAAHSAIWKPLRPNHSLDTLRICYNISGLADPRVAPEEVFVSEIEHCLNRHPAISYIANKSFYDRWFDRGVFPEVYLHNIDGDIYDASYRRIDGRQVRSLIQGLSYPVVMKPNMDSFGGKDICFIQSAEELASRIARAANFVVQERIRQSPVISRFCDSVGLNTFRVCLYRSVSTGEVHPLSVAMRMGKGGSLDNETAGGVVCYCHPDGRFNAYAVDKYGGKFNTHPDTGVAFSSAGDVPDFDKMLNLARDVAQDVYLARLMGLDLCLDADGRWRLIEINLRAQTIRFSQYAGVPFFGDFTDEVVEYCLKHPEWR